MSSGPLLDRMLCGTLRRFHDLIERARAALAGDSCVYFQGEPFARKGFLVVGSMQVRSQCAAGRRSDAFS